MPCFRHKFEEKFRAGESNITKPLSETGSKGKKMSTTDSEEKDKNGAELLLAPQINSNVKQKKPIRQPKIKPNYRTNSGGMFVRRNK